MSQKKAKIGPPKLPKGEAKGRIVPVRFAPDEIKAIVRASRAANQTISEWLREIARFGTMYQPLAAHGSDSISVIPKCPDCRALTINTLTVPICDSCKKSKWRPLRWGAYFKLGHYPEGRESLGFCSLLKRRVLCLP